MCTVLLRWRPDVPWPLLMAAVRDEFLDRPWDPPAPHWPAYPSLVGGRDGLAGGTWLAVDPTRPAVAAVLNGVRLPPEPTRPSRGMLPLAALTNSLPASFEGYDGFHLLIGTVSSVIVLSWDGVSLVRRELAPGDHIIVNAGVDAAEDPLVPHFAPLLAALPDPPLALVDTTFAGPQPPAGPGAPLTTVAAWGPWLDLLRGDGLPPDDPRALLLYTEIDGSKPGMEQYAGRVYGSGSEALVALAPGRARYDFTPT
ncbi:MAG: NRDE family protein, partial [Dactylosporangium sp.]|nr:NRDE family protein [Dactylosporangium sp.]